jgi:anti-anti-sigma factor
LEIERQDIGKVTVLVPEDRFDIIGYIDLEDFLGDLLEEGRILLVMDLRNVTYANSAALGVVATFTREAQIAGGRMVLASVNERIDQLLAVTGLKRDLIKVYADADAAVKALSARGRR